MNIFEQEAARLRSASYDPVYRERRENMNVIFLTMKSMKDLKNSSVLQRPYPEICNILKLSTFMNFMLFTVSGVAACEA